MDLKDLSRPLYSLSIGEFIDLVKEILKETTPPVKEPLPELQDKEEHFTYRQLMKFLDCSKVTLHNYKKKGLPYYRIGRKLLFKKSEVLDFMRNNVRKYFGRKH